MSRTLSWTEISTAATCEARHAFQYTGHLSGGRTFKRREIGAVLSNGRAWGAAIAAWHAGSAGLLAKMDAHAALLASFARDLTEQRDRGFWVPLEDQVLQENRIQAILDHHMDTVVPLENLTRLEEHWLLPIPSRSGGGRSSSRYRYECYIDGFTTDHRESEWIAEFKLRGALTPVWQIQLSRQVRWEAWARQQMTDRQVVGALVDERLAEPPEPPRLVLARRKSDPQDENGRTPSHSMAQKCTPDAYIAICEEYGVEPREATVEAFKQRQWHQQVPIMFTQAELNEAGEELISAAKLVRDLDLGHRYPIRNSQPYICRGCRFKEACPNPDDEIYLDTIFERTTPKRLRSDDTRNSAPSVTAAAPPGKTLRSASGPTADRLGGPTHTPTGRPGTSEREPEHIPEIPPDGAPAFDYIRADYAETEPWHFRGAA